MAAGFQAYKEDGTPLFDTNYLTYGLLASGFLTFQYMGTRWTLASAHLDPTDPGNYRESGPEVPIFGISVANAIAPICFIEGQGAEMPASTVGNITTFYFQSSGPNTRAYIFDVMRDFQIQAGIKTFRDTPTNELTFNSRLIPMDVDHVVGFPPVPQPWGSNPRLTIGPFEGGSFAWTRPSGYGDPIAASLFGCKRFWGLNAAYRYAAHITFSRSYGLGKQDRMGTPIEAGADRGYSFVSSSSAMDGAYGVQGGFYFFSVNIANEAMVPTNNFGVTSYWDVPRNRIPDVLVVRSDILPFPYSAY